MDRLKRVKKIVYYDYAKNDSTQILVEEVLDAAYGCYIWPSALVMGEFVWYYRGQFANTTVLEVGAGTSIPSLVLAKASQVTNLLLTDIPDILPVIQGCLDLNSIEKDVWVQALEWGTFGTESSIDTLVAKLQTQLNTRIDYIIGSDTFYDPSQFENLLVLVSYVIHHVNPNCKFFTTYQERSPKRSIQYLLDKWKLTCRHIPKESFHFDESKYTSVDNKDKSEVRINAGILSSVFLLEISACKL